MPNVTLWLGGIILALCVVIGGQQLRVSALKTEIATMRADYAMQSAQAQADMRAIEHKWQSIADKEVAHAKKQQSIAESAAATVASDADGLRREIRNLRSRLATRDATAAGRGKAEESAFGVLAELFDESVKRNQVLAAEADAARIAGKTCQGIYEKTK